MRYVITQKTLNEAWTREAPTDPDQLRRYWAKLLHEFGPVAMVFLAHKSLWKTAPHTQLGSSYKPLDKLLLGLGECRVLFGFPTSPKNVVTGIRQDGFVLTCQWRSDMTEHSPAIPHNLVLLADSIKEQFHLPEFYLWPAVWFKNTDFSDPALTGGDSLLNIGSAWASLSTGLLLAKRQVVPSHKVFASIQYDFANHKIASVDLIKQKISVIADFAPTTFFVASEQVMEAQKAIADLVAEEEDDERREFLKRIEIAEPQGTDPFSMVRAMAFTDLNTLAMEKRVHELVDLEQQAFRERRINEAFDHYQDRIQLEKSLAFPVSPAREETISSFYKRSCNVKLATRKAETVDEIQTPLPDGMTNVSYSPSGKQWLGWHSQPAWNPKRSRFTDDDAAAYISDESGKKDRLELPFSVPSQVVWDSSETRIAISGKPNDSVKLVLFNVNATDLKRLDIDCASPATLDESLGPKDIADTSSSRSTSSCFTIDDFGGYVPLCITEMYFSPDGQYLFAAGANGTTFIFETNQGKRVAGPFCTSGVSRGNPWIVSKIGCVFLCDNMLYLFHVIERKLYTLIQFVATPNQVCFLEGYCAAVIGDHVWLFDGNTAYLAAPLFKMGPVDKIRLEQNQTIIFTTNDKEEIWQWQNPYAQTRIIRTEARQVHSIDVSPNGLIWLLHDHQLTILDQNTENQETFPNVVYTWPQTGSFLISDSACRHPQSGNIFGKKRFCNFDLPFAGKIQSDKLGKYLVLTSTVVIGSLFSATSQTATSSFGMNSFPAKTTICYNLNTDEEVWRHKFADQPEPAQFTTDGQYTIISTATGGYFFFNNETGQLTENTEITSAFSVEKTPVSPVENGYYQSEQITCEYYDRHRDWFWLATASGRVFTLERETLNPTIVAFQFSTAVQVIKVLENQYFFGLPNNIIFGKLIWM